MKRFICYSVICLFTGLFLISCNEKKETSIEGAWNLIDLVNVKDGSVVNSLPGNISGKQMKIWYDDNFVFVGEFMSDTTEQNNFGGGTCTLNGNRYEENLSYHVNSDYIGTTVKMLIEINHDTLIHKWPVDSNWTLDDNNYNMEKYVRIK